jgi:hypothetical protein
VSVPYTRKTWYNAPDTRTPISGDSLTDFERRVAAGFAAVPEAGSGTGGASSRDAVGVAALFAALDMKDPRPLSVYICSDSTGVPVAAWQEAAWKALLASHYPERQALVRRATTGGTLAAAVQWQAGASGSGGGGTTVREKIVVLQDTFAGQPGELVGTTATGAAGGAWATATGGTGQFTRATTASSFVESTAGRVADIAKSDYILYAPSDATAEGDLDVTLRVSTNSASAVTTRLFPLRKATFDGTRIEVVASSAGTSVTVFARTSGVTRTLGSITGTPIPLNTVNNFVRIKHAVVANADGTGTLTVTVGSQVGTFALTAADMTQWATCDRFEFASTDPTFRMATVTVNSFKTTTSGGTATGGLPPITIYNLSASGQTAQWQQDRIPALFPARPDLVMNNHGMNYEADAPDVYLAKLAAFESAVAAAFDDAVPHWYVSPNTRVPAAGVPSDRVPSHRARTVALRSWTASRGTPYSGVYERFAQRSDDGAGILLDDKHPDATGNALGTGVVRADLAAQSKRVPA